MMNIATTTLSQTMTLALTAMVVLSTQSLPLAHAEEPVRQTPPQADPFATFLPFAILAGMLVFMMLMARSQRRKEERARQGLMDSLAPKQRVLMAGGIKGSIVSMKDDDIIVKVDEATNTKITFTRSAVQQILND